MVRSVAQELSVSSRGSVLARARDAPAAGTVRRCLTSGDGRDNLKLHELNMVSCGSGVVHHAIRAGANA
eukprot:6205876-Pleurochrysis_carterae.AAC.1